ncbi:hypothetical protein LCW13_06615 [Cobetia amphilecti]|uniref:hypothetical protein n=1 Tax=Cobetia amphilecti TaxID=1055104 RepID=UPI001CDA62D8|nr:hypothetical protein [Cobetia amphilecti]UBU49919.1 hypothetical protein LCW13_06615 [Cobetia amphilecti]
MYRFKESDLTSEKSLWDVYILSRRILPGKFQVIFVAIIFLLLSLNAFLLSNDEEIILSDLRKWSEMGFNFSITTLGFLIAGFTIFATLSKPKMMLAMMDHVNKETGLPTLKYNFFAFIKVFISYIFFLVFYALILLFGQPGGFIANLSEHVPSFVCVKYVTINIVYAIVGSSFIYLLLLLKSFVFNIYAIVMNMLRWEYFQD